MTTWINTNDALPELFEKVFGICGGHLHAFMRMDDEGGWAWARCHSGCIDETDDYEIDDDYHVTHWIKFPEMP